MLSHQSPDSEVTRQIMRLGEDLVEGWKTNDIIQYGHHMLTSWTTHGCLG